MGARRMSDLSAFRRQDPTRSTPSAILWSDWGVEDHLPELRERIRTLTKTVAERTAQSRVIQRELESYEEIDHNRRSITEHLLLDMRVGATGPDGPGESEELRRLQSDNDELRRELADESALAASKATIAELRAGLESEQKRAEGLARRTAADAETHTETLAGTKKKEQELEAGIATERARAEDRRKAWQISVDADKMRASRAEQELANIRDELERAALDERTRIKALETSLATGREELEAARAKLASEQNLLEGARRLTEILRAKLGQMQEMINLHAGQDGDATGAGAAALADLDPATELDGLLDEQLDTATGDKVDPDDT
jgi:hypothetical protein